MFANIFYLSNRRFLFEVGKHSDFPKMMDLLLTHCWSLMVRDCIFLLVKMMLVGVDGHSALTHKGKLFAG